MKVIVSGELWTSPGHVVKLHKLMTHAYDNRHVIVSDPPEAVFDWLGTLGSETSNAYLALVEWAEKEASQLPADIATVRICMTDTPYWGDPEAVLPLDEALQLLAEPLGILLENSTTDWNFLLGMMAGLERKRLLEAVENRWAEPLLGGGTALRAELDKRVSHNAKRLRTFVMFDSDRLHPDELEPEWRPANHKECPAFGWEELANEKIPGRYWRLQRRFIESYMPQRELPKAANSNTHPGAINAFFRMTRAQRWYYNMKSGFAGDRKREDLHRLRGLYDSIAGKPDEAALEQGFGKDIAKHYTHAPTGSFDWDDDARKEARAAIPRLMRLL